MGDPVGRKTGRRADISIGVNRDPVAILQFTVLVIADAGKDTAARSGEPLERLTGVFERFPGHLQKKPVLRVHARGLARRNTEKLRIEAVDIIEKRALGSI